MKRFIDHVLRPIVAVACAAATGLVPQQASAEEDPWPCQVALCLANPKGPTALKECEPPIKRAWKAWAKGKRVPDCKKKDASKTVQCWHEKGKVDESCPEPTTGGSLREDGTYIEEQVADPKTNCPFVYVATRELTPYCAFTGVTNQYINGRLWGRIWYGGPGGRPYIEQLEDSPIPQDLLTRLLNSEIDARAKQTLIELSQPRQPDGFEDAWAALKSSIEDKAHYAALAWKIYVDADKRAVAAERRAYDATRIATDADNEVSRLELTAPETLAAARARNESAYQAYLQAQRDADTARTLAERKGATDEDRARYLDALAAMRGRQDELRVAIYEVNLALQLVQSLPTRRENANRLIQTAQTLSAEASKLRAAASTAKAEADQAEINAQPLPVYEG